MAELSECHWVYAVVQSETRQKGAVRGELGLFVDRFYIALFSAFEQTDSARMWFYMNEQLFIALL